MSDNPVQVLIDGLVAQIEEMEKPTRPLKAAVNALCDQAGLPHRYGDHSDGGGGARPPGLTVRNDQFFNRPLATCVMEIMEMRKQKGVEGATGIDEIYLALTKGGYRFETTGEDNTKRAIKISLAKNTAQFVKIGDDTFSLKKWYGNGRSTRKSASKSTNDDDGAPEETEVDPRLEFENISDDPAAPETDAKG